MTWDTNRFYLVTGAYSIVDIINYSVNTTNANEATYTITVVNVDGNSANVIWDRVNFTYSIDYTWTICTYNLNVSWTSYYAYDGELYNGTFVVANDTTVVNEAASSDNITKTTVGNYTFYTVSITDPEYSLTAFNTNTVWGVYDNITATVYYYTVSMTPTLNLFNVVLENVTWTQNGTFVPADWILMNMKNGTLISNSTTLGTGFVTPSVQTISVSSTDDGIAYTNNATETIGSRVFNFQWYEVEADVAEDLNIEVETQEILDEDVVVSGTTNINFTYTVYEEDSSIETGSGNGTGDEWGWKIIFDLNQTYGWHNFSIYFNAGSSGNRWYNSSYFYEEWDWVYMNIIGPNAMGLDPILFQIRVNDTRIWSGNPRFWARTDASYNISISNFLNESVSEAIYAIPSDRIIDISINVYTLTIYSQLEEEFIYFNLTSSGGAVWSEHVSPRHDAKIAIYASTDYTYAFTVYTGGSGGTFTGTINIDYDYGIIIEGYNLVKIYRGLQEVGGGALTGGEVLSVLQSAYGPILGQVQFFSWLIAIMMFMGLYLVPFLAKKAKGEKIFDLSTSTTDVDISGAPSATTGRKKPVPKQLKKHAFKGGPANPKYKGGKVKLPKPKKGRSLDEMSDFMWDKLKKGRAKR
jgi:hypothetical protein